MYMNLASLYLPGKSFEFDLQTTLIPMQHSPMTWSLSKIALVKTEKWPRVQEISYNLSAKYKVKRILFNKKRIV